MVYMAGDNNLSNDMVTALKYMRHSFIDANEDTNFALLAYFDSGAVSYPSMYIDFTASDADLQEQQRRQHHQYDVTPPLGSLHQVQNEDTSLSSIEEFVRWCVTDEEIAPGKKGCGYKAENYALIFSGHGDGFQPSTFLSDNNSNKSVSVMGLSQTLAKIKRKYLDDQKIAVLGFDSCVMGTVEVAYEMRRSAEYMVSSQGFIPNSGWNYEFIYNVISKKNKSGDEEKKTTPLELAEIISKSFVVQNIDYSLYSGRSIDISICKLDKVGTIASRIHQLGTDLAHAVLTEIKEAEAIPPAERENSNFDFVSNAILLSHHHSQTYLCEQSVDIVDFAKLLRTNCKKTINLLKSIDGNTKYKTTLENLKTIVKSADNLLKSLDKALQCFYLGAEFQYSNGLSLYFPWSFFSYNISKKNYLKFNFAKGKPSAADEIKKAIGVVVPNEENVIPESPWADFLTRYLWATIRDVRNESGFDVNVEDKLYILNLTPPEIEKLPPTERAFLEINPTLNKFNPPRDAKFNPPRDAKFNPPRDAKLLGNYFSDLENFSRTKNFPWGARYWGFDPEQNLFEVE